MEEYTKKFYENSDNFIKGSTMDLSMYSFLHPWSIGITCLFLIQYLSRLDGDVILPKNGDALCYLKRMHFDKFLDELGYEKTAKELRTFSISERENFNVQEILHCKYSDEFNGRLGYLEKIFRNFGLNDEDAKRALMIVGELGNNVFDHNLGNWPTNFSGAIIAGQSYPLKKRIEFIVVDAGVGFLGSLKNAFPDLKSDVDAIKKGLDGFTGRIGERRGNGLKSIQQWTIKNFHGILTIHSGSGLVQVDEGGIEEKNVFPILGTLAQFVIYYK